MEEIQRAETDLQFLEVVFPVWQEIHRLLFHSDEFFVLRVALFHILQLFGHLENTSRQKKKGKHNIKNLQYLLPTPPHSKHPWIGAKASL